MNMNEKKIWYSGLICSIYLLMVILFQADAQSDMEGCT